jgi:phosphoglycerate kinase
LANNFFKLQGYEVGRSQVDDENFGLDKLLKNKKIFLPVDVVVQKGIEASVKRPDEVLADEKIVDAGPETVVFLKDVIKNSKLVLWNGPLGFYEGGFDKASAELLKSLSKSKAETIIGGGDTVALVSKLKLEKKMTFVSTGGGATLDFLTKGTLPGIEVLHKKLNK